MKVATRRCQNSAPLTPPPLCSFTSKNLNQPWRELSVRDDVPVIIAWVRDYALFFCKLPYLQSRMHWAHVQLIHCSSNSRSNYRVWCKFNYSTCRKQKRNLIVKFVLLRWKIKKKKGAEVVCVSWIHFTPQSQRVMNSVPAAEASLDRILFHFFFFPIFSITMSCWNFFLRSIHMYNSHSISRGSFGTTSLPFESGSQGWESSKLDLW